MLVDSTVKWTKDVQCPVLLTFDFDAESLWIGRDPANANRAGTLSQGTYGAWVGVPSILQLLRDMGGLPATFFVPGTTAENHTSRVEAIVAAGHEIGHHSYSHRWIEPGDIAGEIEELDRGLDALQRMVGVRPIGYRSPAGETSNDLIRLLIDRGFVYDSSLMAAINPYFHKTETGQHLVEIPWHWSLDDAVFMLFSIRSPRAIMTNDHVFSVWAEEFRVIHEAGCVFNLVMHPQVIGRPSRLALLKRFIEYVQAFPGVRFTTCREVAQAFIQSSVADTAA
jgi:peptidoglycan/xylan/chitin deacetylase (PgdA/CDA1 family)